MLFTFLQKNFLWYLYMWEWNLNTWRKKNWVHVRQKIKNMKINRNVDKLKIITKSVINVIFSTIKTMFDNVMMRLVQYWNIKSSMICHKSRSFNSLQHLHFIEIGFKVQCKDLYNWRFPCLLDFRSFSSSLFSNSSSLYSYSPA